MRWPLREDSPRVLDLFLRYFYTLHQNIKIPEGFSLSVRRQNHHHQIKLNFNVSQTCSRSGNQIDQLHYGLEIRILNIFRILEK